VFHRSLLACCLEIITFTYKPPGNFPFITEIFDIPVYHFYKVKHLIARNPYQVMNTLLTYMKKTPYLDVNLHINPSFSALPFFALKQYYPSACHSGGVSRAFKNQGTVSSLTQEQYPSTNRVTNRLSFFHELLSQLFSNSA